MTGNLPIEVSQCASHSLNLTLTYREFTGNGAPGLTRVQTAIERGALMGESRAVILDAWPPDSPHGHAQGLRDALARIGHRQVASVSIQRAAARASHDFVNRLLKLSATESWTEIYVLGAPDITLLSSRQRVELEGVLESSRVLYWESDAWGRGKPVAPQVRFWLRNADIVVHTGGFNSIQRLTSPSTRIRFAPPCYCHQTFADAERRAPGPEGSGRVVMIANNVTKTRVPVPGITGIAGGFARWRAALILSRQLGPETFHLHGKGWPSQWSRGPLPFHRQVSVMRDSTAVAIWDHFQARTNYASNRLPIALLSGRPVFSSPVRQANWLPDALLGLNFRTSIAELVASVKEAVGTTTASTTRNPAETWEWVRHRLSTARLGEFFVEQMHQGSYPNLPFPWSRHRDAEIEFRPTTTDLHD